MKFVHSLALSCGLLLCILAYGSASVASANELHLDSCMEGGSCQTTSKGATFKAKGKVTLQNAFLEDTCTSEIEGEVLVTLSQSLEENMEAAISKATATGCSGGEALTQGLAWTLTSNLEQFPEALIAGGVKFIVHAGGETGDCTFEEDATHMANASWKNGKASLVKLGGTLKKVSGGKLCGSEASLSGSWEINAVTDAKLEASTTLQIKETKPKEPLHLESCMEGGECDTATNGTTFKAKGKVTLQNGFLEDTCTSEIKGEVAATLSKNAEEDIKAELTEAAYTSCSEGTALPQGFSWALTTDFAQFPEALVAGGVKFILHIGGETGDCTFEKDASHMPSVVWKNGKPTVLKVSGNLKKVSGSSLCGAEANLSGAYELTSVSDSKLAGATNLQILEGPTMTEELLEKVMEEEELAEEKVLEEEELEAKELKIMEEELAGVKLETCHQEESECALASKGTVLYFSTPTSVGERLRFSSSPLGTNNCASQLEAEVLSPLASPKEELKLVINWATLEGCSLYSSFVNEETLPWFFTTTEEEFEAESKGSLSGGVLVGWTFWGCYFKETAEDAIRWKYIPGEKEEHGPQFELSGSLAVEPGSFCGLMAVLEGSKYELTEIYDPELPEAIFARISS